MIEIKHVNGSVLYTVKNATDVRAAVSEAARVDAYFAGAYLAGAYLAGAYLAGANLAGAYLAGADLARADLAGAYLARADLAGADLAGANLAGAYLAGADLAGANLAGANLARADLARAKGYNPWAADSLRMLLHQTGKIRAYKLVDDEYRSPIQTKRKLTYRVGETITVTSASTDEAFACAPGVNVADLPWCIREWRADHRIMLVEFTAKDIAAIPHGTDGKFRVRRCKVVRELDLAEIGLAVSPAGTAEA